MTMALLKETSESNRKQHETEQAFLNQMMAHPCRK